jgi:hypothetical protein
MVHQCKRKRLDGPEVEVARWALGISVLALVVSVGSFFLELRRWFDEGVKLSLSVMAECNRYGGGIEDKNDYLALRVTNRGSAATTITHMILYDYPRWLDRWIRRQKPETMLVPLPTLPGMGGQLPHVLQPGQVWQGLVTHTPDLKQIIARGRLHVGVIGSHYDKPILERVRSWKPPEDAGTA